jgi:hypothetical protein
VGDPRRVLAATDCGFDTSAGMGQVAEGMVRAKLEALAAGAACFGTGVLGGQGCYARARSA